MNKRRIAGAIFLLVAVAGTAVAQRNQRVSDLVDGEPVIWTGDRITFTKADGADPTAASNQDRITDSVWITRGNDGGQIYNALERNRAISSRSPEGTLWAVGTTDELDSLRFSPFRQAVGKPKEVVGKDLVLFIVEEEVFIDVTFTSWSKEKQGGFAYERSTPE